MPIEQVAQQLRLQVSHHHSLCPFHRDKHPSLTFDTRRNRFRCFVCGEHGSTIDLVMKVRHLTFPEACHWLSEGTITSACPHDQQVSTNYQNDNPQGTFDASRYARFFERPYLSPEACHFLFDERRLDPRVVSQCRLNSYRDRQGVHWLQTPYYDMDGKLIGVQSRNLSNSVSLSHLQSDATFVKGGQVESQPRFRFPRYSRCSIYNLPILKQLQPGEELYITEGCSDCWAMLSAGHKAIAIPSATLLKPEDISILKAKLSTPNPPLSTLNPPLSPLTSPLSTNIHMYPDQDEPGERLFLQLRDLLPHLIRHQLPSGHKDFAEYYMNELAKGKR